MLRSSKAKGARHAFLGCPGPSAMSSRPRHGLRLSSVRLIMGRCRRCSLSSECSLHRLPPRSCCCCCRWRCWRHRWRLLRSRRPPALAPLAAALLAAALRLARCGWPEAPPLRARGTAGTGTSGAVINGNCAVSLDSGSTRTDSRGRRPLRTTEKGECEEGGTATVPQRRGCVSTGARPAPARLCGRHLGRARAAVAALAPTGRGR